MTVTGLPQFDHSIHTANTWIHQLAEGLGYAEDRGRAYHALRAVLHALRDRLTVNEAAALAAQLPMLVRGLYYEGWHPAGKPVHERTREQFLARVAAELRPGPQSRTPGYGEGDAPNTPGDDPDAVTRAVFRLLKWHVSPGEIRGVMNMLPEEVKTMWE